MAFAKYCASKIILWKESLSKMSQVVELYRIKKKVNLFG